MENESNVESNNLSSNTIIQSDVSKGSVIRSLIWKFLERGGTQGVQFIIQIVLARLLFPEDYGVLAILVAFVQIATVFVQSGFNTALIQKKDADQTDFSSVFYLSLFVAAILYLILFSTAPFIARFYDMPTLSCYLRVISVTLFFGAFNSVQNAMVSKTMQFKRFFYSSTGAAIGSGVVGIALAYTGFGVWALVAQQLTSNFLICTILWFTVKWRPQLKFSFARIKSLFSFGWKLLCSALLDTGYRQLYNLVVGRVFTKADLGEYSRGQQFPQLISTNLDGSIQSVMLPTLSAHNDSRDEVKRIMRRSITTSAFVLMPCMFGMAACARSLVLVLLTEKWLGCVPFLMLSCFSYSIYPIHTANLTAINAMGRSDVFLRLEIIKKCIGISIVLVTIRFGLIYMVAAQIFGGIISSFINAYPNKRLLSYSYFEQVKDLAPGFLASAAMFVCVYLLGKIDIAPLPLLMLQVLSGVVFYILLSVVFRIEAFEYLLATIRGFRNGRKQQ